MDTTSTTAEYDRLIARHHAMRLRRQILAPAPSFSADPSAPPGPSAHPGGADGRDRYDGAADQRLILQDLALVTPFDRLIDHLYACMFRRRPYLRALFPESMEFQQAHLERMFDYLVERLDRPDELADTLTRLGRDHRKLGVRPVHYEAFEEALREAIRYRAGSRWHAGLEAAWVRMLRFTVRSMVAGAEAALTEPRTGTPRWSATNAAATTSPCSGCAPASPTRTGPDSTGRSSTRPCRTPGGSTRWAARRAPTTSWSSTSAAPGRVG